MSDIYLKVTIEKKWRTQNFDFLSLKCSSSGRFLKAPAQADITEFSNFMFQLKNQRSGSKTVSGFSITLILKGILRF